MKKDVSLSFTQIQENPPYYIVHYGELEARTDGATGWEGSCTIPSQEKLKRFLSEWEKTLDDIKETIVLRLVDVDEVVRLLSKHCS